MATRLISKCRRWKELEEGVIRIKKSSVQLSVNYHARHGDLKNDYL